MLSFRRIFVSAVLRAHTQCAHETFSCVTERTDDAGQWQQSGSSAARAHLQALDRASGLALELSLIPIHHLLHHADAHALTQAAVGARDGALCAHVGAPVDAPHRARKREVPRRRRRRATAVALLGAWKASTSAIMAPASSMAFVGALTKRAVVALPSGLAQAGMLTGRARRHALPVRPAARRPTAEALACIARPRHGACTPTVGLATAVARAFHTARGTAYAPAIGAR